MQRLYIDGSTAAKDLLRKRDNWEWDEQQEMYFYPAKETELKITYTHDRAYVLLFNEKHRLPSNWDNIIYLENNAANVIWATQNCDYWEKIDNEIKCRVRAGIKMSEIPHINRGQLVVRLVRKHNKRKK